MDFIQSQSDGSDAGFHYGDIAVEKIKTLQSQLEMLTKCDGERSITKMKCYISPMDKKNWCQGCKNKKMLEIKNETT